MGGMETADPSRPSGTGTGTGDDLLVFVGTYNAQSKLPYQSLDTWLFKGILESVNTRSDYATDDLASHQSRYLRLPHLVCITFQEFGPLNTALLDANRGLIRSCTTLVQNSLTRLTNLANRGMRTGRNEVALPSAEHLSWTFRNSELEVKADPGDWTLAHGASPSVVADPLTTLATNASFHYENQATYHYAGLLMFVYSLEESTLAAVGHPALVDQHRTQITRVGTGPAYVGLKGAIGISVAVHPPQRYPSESRTTTADVVTEALRPPIRICFVGSHLTAHEHLTRQRNRDYRNIIRRLLFCFGHRNGSEDCINPEGDWDDRVLAEKRRPVRPTIVPEALSTTPSLTRTARKTLFDHHHVFFAGDLNYRATRNLQRPLLVPLPQAEQQALFKFDELTRVRHDGEAFGPFDEAPVRFNPTYKFTVGCNLYAYRKRNPSWCDRILYWSRGVSTASRSSESSEDESSYDDDHEKPATAPTVTIPTDSDHLITPLYYDGHFDYSISDHRPVSGLFRIANHAPDDPTTAKLDPHGQSTTQVTVDPWWTQKLTIGRYMDRLVGTCWCASMYLSLSPFHLTLAVLSVGVLIMLIFSVSPYDLLRTGPHGTT